MKKIFCVFITMLFLLTGCFDHKTTSVDIDQPELPEISKIGTSYGSFIDVGGELYTWGFDARNAGAGYDFGCFADSIGQGTEIIYNNNPTKIASGVACRILDNKGLTQNGEMIMWGKYMENDPCVPRVFKENVAKVETVFYLTTNGELHSYPEGDNTQLTTPYENNTNLIMTEVMDVKQGYIQYFALKKDGSVWAVKIGNSMTGETKENPKKLIEHVEKIYTLFYGSALFLKDDGSIWSYGDNEYGQCGNGEHGDLDNKTQDCVVAEPYKLAENVIDAWVTGPTMFYLTEDYKLYACGRNDNDLLLIGGKGQMDRYNYPDFVTTPVLVMENVRQIQCGDNGMIVLKTDHTVWSWGYADKGTLGNGICYEGDDLGRNHFSERMLRTGEAFYSQPTRIMENVNRLFTETAGLHFAQKIDGSVWYWGYGEIYVDEDDDWDTEVQKPNNIKAYQKHYIIPTPIEFSVDTYFQTALDYIAAQSGADVSQYQAVKYK